MWNPFKRKSKSLKALQPLQPLSATFAILNKFERRGLLHWQSSPSHKGEGRGGASLLIEESLATIQLAQGAEAFRHFLTQCAQWQNFKLLQEAYERHRIDIEAKAVREAKSSLPMGEGGGRGFSKADITRIRQNARDNMSEIDISTLPFLLTGGAGGGSDFDLFIIRAIAPSSAQATEANGQLLALGHYDGKTLEMAMYDDIKHNLQTGSGVTTPSEP